METLLGRIKKIIPHSLFNTIQPLYHFFLALLGACIYRFPSRHIHVVFITGTKGKSSTVEILNSIFEAAGKKTAVAGTIRFKIGTESHPNLYKMTMPGRFFVQKFLRKAVNAGCEYAILEMTSEAAHQYRHYFISFDGLIFLNISPEHIESHGGYENYLKAKLSLADALAESVKKSRLIVANSDDKESEKFLLRNVDSTRTFSIKGAEPYSLTPHGTIFTFKGTRVHASLLGLFNIYNMLAAATYASERGIDTDTIRRGLEKIKEIKGRVEKVELNPSHSRRGKRDFEVVVDYAHTADSLEKLYQAFPTKRKICVLGSTGGGRDTWKRPLMGTVADMYCNEIFLTNEDPYDEDPKTILDEITKGISHHLPKIILDRREAIHEAVKSAKTGDVVLITGKGTDPYTMEANGKKTPWSDTQVAKEELEKILQ